MEDTDQTPSPPPSGGGQDTVTIFLGLYLLILAFFILLVSISNIEEVKSKAVMNSLTSTFATLLPPTSAISDYSGQSGDVLAGQQFQERIAGLFSSAVQVAKIEMVQPGRQMRITLPSSVLFEDGQPTIRAAQIPLLDRVVAALSRRPPGLKFDLEFVIGSRYVRGRLPIGQTLELDRAGTFVREMTSRGAPPDSVVIGIKPGDPAELVLYFFARPLLDDPLGFEEIGAETPDGAS